MSNTYYCRTAWQEDCDAKKIEADDVEKAACKFCEIRDWQVCEFPDEQEITVVGPGIDGPTATVTVCSAAVREYWVPRKRRASS